MRLKAIWWKTVGGDLHDIREKFKENFIPKGLQCGAKEDYLFKLAKIY